MSFNYNPAETTDSDKIRGKVGDTNVDDPLLDDATVEALLIAYPSVIAASVEACKRIIARFARDTDVSGAGLSASRSQREQHFQDLLKELLRERGASATMFAGGLSKSANRALASDPDAREPIARFGQDDYR